MGTFAVHCGDCNDLMANLKPKSVDCIITDPPFGIDFKAKKANYNRNKDLVIDGYREVHNRDYYDFTLEWMTNAKRVLKETGSMMIFSGYNNMSDILLVIKKLDLKLVNQIIWRYRFGVYTKKKFVTSHYNIFYVCKNEKKRKFYDPIKNDTKLSYRERESVWEISREYWTGKTKTPTKLPLEICQKILKYTSKKNDTILDPFMGSGQIGFASLASERHFIGCEINPEYFKFAEERIRTGKYLI